MLSGTGAHLDLRAPSTDTTVAKGDAAHISCSTAATAPSYSLVRCHRNSQALGPSRYITCSTAKWQYKVWFCNWWKHNLALVLAGSACSYGFQAAMHAAASSQYHHRALVNPPPKPQ